MDGEDGHGPAISELRFRFGTRNLKPKMHWLCETGCVGGCNCPGAELVMQADDGEHIELELEHAQ